MKVGDGTRYLDNYFQSKREYPRDHGNAEDQSVDRSDDDPCAHFLNESNVPSQLRNDHRVHAQPVDRPRDGVVGEADDPTEDDLVYL